MTDVGLSAIPLQGLIGGAMIGLASALMLLALGRIAGNSGLAARASGLSTDGAPWSWAMAFIVGLPLGVAIITLLIGPVQTHFPANPAILAVGGLAVGFGSPSWRSASTTTSAGSAAITAASNGTSAASVRSGWACEAAPTALPARLDEAGPAPSRQGWRFAPSLRALRP